MLSPAAESSPIASTLIMLPESSEADGLLSEELFPLSAPVLLFVPCLTPPPLLPPEEPLRLRELVKLTLTPSAVVIPFVVEDPVTSLIVTV